MLWQYKLDKNFDLTIEENRSLLSSMTTKICFKMSMKSLVDHFPSTEFSIGDWHWQNSKLVLFYNHFFRLQSNSTWAIWDWQFCTQKSSAKHLWQLSSGPSLREGGGKCFECRCVPGARAVPTQPWPPEEDGPLESGFENRIAIHPRWGRGHLPGFCNAAMVDMY